MTRPFSNIASAIDTVVFYALLAVIALAAIPYGTVEPWWKAAFACLVFALAALSILWQLIGRESKRSLKFPPLFFPVIGLIAFAAIQTIPWSRSTIAGVSVGQTLSADPFHTWQFAVQLLALLLLAWLLLLHTTTARRLRFLVDVIIAIGAVSAVFGLCRQAAQTRPGFVLPYLQPGYGYGQFINSNHFAFLMELVVGLALGMVVFGGVRGGRRVIYLIAAVPMWLALVLANSRGGISSMLCQVMFLAAVFVSQRETSDKPNLSRTRRLVIRGALIVILLLGAVVTVVFVGGDPLAGKIDSLSVEMDRKTADFFSLRPNIWRATWELIKAHPIAGSGFGGYWVAITEYHQGSGEASPQEAHNDYLELIASGGLIGLALGIWAAFAFVKTALKKVHGDDRFLRAAKFAALAGIVAVAVHSLVDFGLHLVINAAIFTVLISIVFVSAEGFEDVKS